MQISCPSMAGLTPMTRVNILWSELSYRVHSSEQGSLDNRIPRLMDVPLYACLELPRWYLSLVSQRHADILGSSLAGLNLTLIMFIRFPALNSFVFPTWRRLSWGVLKKNCWLTFCVIPVNWIPYRKLTCACVCVCVCTFALALYPLDLFPFPVYISVVLPSSAKWHHSRVKHIVNSFRSHIDFTDFILMYKM